MTRKNRKKPMNQTTDVATIDKIIAALKEGYSFCLSGHENPDPDVVGSQLAMAGLIRRLGKNKEIHIQNSGTPPKSLSFLPGFDQVKSVKKAEGRYDVLIVFECSGADRMGNILDFKTQVGTVINIDHHLHNPNFGHINWVEPTTSSTAEMIFKIFERAGVEPSKAEATCLYTGVVADTGCFRYGNTNTQTHDIGGKLIAAGVPVAEVSEAIYMGRTRAAMQLLSHAITNMQLIHDDRVAILKLPNAVYKEVQASSDDTEEIVNAGLLMGSVVASVLLKEKTNPDVVKVSFRSKGNYDINQVARRFGGGGHRNASGCSIPGSLADAEKAVLKEIGRIF
jgi:phosphoesterase RecJ-like protein